MTHLAAGLAAAAAGGLAAAEAGGDGTGRGRAAPPAGNPGDGLGPPTAPAGPKGRSFSLAACQPFYMFLKWLAHAGLPNEVNLSTTSNTAAANLLQHCPAPDVATLYNPQPLAYEVHARQTEYKLLQPV